MEAGFYLAAGGLLLTIGGIVAGRASAWGSAKERLKAVEESMKECQPACREHIVSRDEHTHREWRDSVTRQLEEVGRHIEHVRDELSKRMSGLEEAVRNGR